MPRDVVEPATESLELPDGATTTLFIRRSPRARRVVLRVRTPQGGVELVLPARMSLARGMAFARSKAGWIAERLAEMPEPVPFDDGACIPLLGYRVTIRHVEEAFRDIWLRDDALYVSGPRSRVAASVEQWLREEARRELTRRARDKAARLGREAGRVRIRDTRTRWGSCTTDGDLNFSWRLVFTPEPVLDYVVAHEVAHLVEFNHSPRFWRIVRELCTAPDESRRWLRENGFALHAYGAERRSVQAL